MMLLSVVSKVLGFVREIVLSNIFGAGEISDAFIFSYGLAGTIFSVFVAAFVTGLIPMFTKIEKSEGEKEANLFMNNVQNTMVIIGLAVSLFFFFFTEFSLSLLVPNASPELLAYMIPFTKITVFSIVFTCFIQVLTGYLHVKNSFIVPVIISFPTNIILIATMFISTRTSYMVLPYGILLAYIIQALIIFVYAKKCGFSFKMHVNLKDKNLRTMLYLAIPLILGSATSTIGGLVNQSIASGTNGGISYINYASRIGNIVEGIFGVAIVSVMFPTLSKMVANKEFKGAREVFEQSLTTLILFILPCAIGMLFLARPVVEFIYMRGAFGSQEVAMLMPVFITYSLGLVSYSTYGLVAKVYYSFQDTRTPMFVAMLNISIQIVLGITLSNLFGLPGITMAMATSSTIGVVVLLIRSKKLFHESLSKAVIIDLVKILTSSLLMGITALVIYNLVKTSMSSLISLALSILGGAVVYIVFIYLMKIEVVEEFIVSIRKKVKTN